MLATLARNDSTRNGEMADQTQAERMTTGRGFIAALDQSGGSTPKALKLYGVEEDEYSGDARCST